MKRILQMGKGYQLLSKPAQKQIKGGEDEFPLWDGDGYVVQCYFGSAWMIVPNQAACATRCGGEGQVEQCVPAGQWGGK